MLQPSSTSRRSLITSTAARKHKGKQPSVHGVLRTKHTLTSDSRTHARFLTTFIRWQESRCCECESHNLHERQTKQPDVPARISADTNHHMFCVRSGLGAGGYVRLPCGAVGFQEQTFKSGQDSESSHNTSSSKISDPESLSTDDAPLSVDTSLLPACSFDRGVSSLEPTLPI